MSFKPASRRGFSEVTPALAVALFLLLLVSSANAQSQIRTLTTDGAWTWFNDPRGLVSDGKLYTGWINSGGYVQVAGHDLAAGATNVATLYNGQVFQRDDHDNPAILRNSANSFTAFYAPHGGASVRMQDVTVNPNGSLSPGPVVGLTHPNDVTGSSGWTYANPYRLSNDGGGPASKTHLFSRGPNFNPVYRVRDDATGTWGAASNFILNGSERPYVKYHSNDIDRVGFAFTDGHPRNVSNHIYYAYMQNGAYRRVDGSVIKNVSAGPLTPADMGGVGTIYNPTDANPNNGSDSWIWDVATDSTGAPVIVYATFKSDTQHQYHWARWNGTQWEDRTLIDVAGTTIAMSGETHYSGGLTLDPTNPNIVYLSRQDASGNWDLEQWKTANGGQTWTTLTVAEGNGAGLENIRPFVPQDRPAGTEMVLWMSGRYDFWDFRTSGALAGSVGYDTDIKLWLNPVPEPASLGLLALAGVLMLRPH